MSGLVFVRDAQGRPLMPMSAAFARTLLQEGKARRWPHPALNIIQLTRIVAQPVVRPVLVGVTLNPSTADLVAVIDRARTSPTYLHIVVDMRRNMFYPRMASSRRPRPYTPQAIRPIAANRIHHRSQMIIEVLGLIQQVLPVSHVILLPSGPGSSLTIRAANREMQSLMVKVTPSFDEQVVVTQHVASLNDVPRPLVRMLTTVSGQVSSRLPDLVACSINDLWVRTRPSAEHGLQARQASRKLLRRQLHTEVRARPLQRQVRLYTVRQNGRTVTGLARTVAAGQMLKLWVPTSVDGGKVRWRSILSLPEVPRQIWPAASVALLLFAPVKGRSP